MLWAEHSVPGLVFEVFVNKYGIFEYDIEMQILIAQPSRFLIFLFWN